LLFHIGISNHAQSTFLSQGGRRDITLASLANLTPHAELVSTTPSGELESSDALFAADTTKPWQQKARRVGQLNFTQHDAVALNVEGWADYWQSLKVDAVFISITGIIAYYPTQVPFHRRSKFLGDRDLFGDCCQAAKKRKIRIVGKHEPRP
jgi:hypothetical protein